MNTRSEKQAVATEKWVECLNCSHEYVIEYVIDEKDAGCPVCGSHTYEETTTEYNNWGD